MHPHLARFLFENSPWPPFLSAWMVGFCIVLDGRVYLTDSGEQYLEARDAAPVSAVPAWVNALNYSFPPHQALIAWS